MICRFLFLLNNNNNLTHLYICEYIPSVYRKEFTFLIIIIIIIIIIITNSTNSISYNTFCILLSYVYLM